MRINSFIAMCLGAVSLVVLAVVLLFSMPLTANIFQAVPTVVGPGGVTPDVIAVDTAWVMFGSVGMLSIPVAILAYLLLGGDSGGRRGAGDDPQVPRSGGPPF